MALAFEFIDFVARVETIRARYPGGWEQCLADHASLVGRRVWYDDHLFRDGAMNPGCIGREAQARAIRPENEPLLH